jgi:hypothetical protein
MPCAISSDNGTLPGDIETYFKSCLFQITDRDQPTATAVGASVGQTHQNKKTIARNHAKKRRRGSGGWEGKREEGKRGEKRSWRDSTDL